MVDSIKCTELTDHSEGIGLSISDDKNGGGGLLRSHPSSRGLVFGDHSAVTMRSCARLTSDKLTRCFGRSATGRTTQSKYISGVGLFLHAGKDDASNKLRKYVQFCTTKLFASPFRKPESQSLAYRPPFFGHAANLKSLRYLAVHPSIRQRTQVLVGRTAPERTRRGCLLVTVGKVPRVGVDHWYPRYYAIYVFIAAFARPR